MVNMLWFQNFSGLDLHKSPGFFKGLFYTKRHHSAKKIDFWGDARTTLFTNTVLYSGKQLKHH